MLRTATVDNSETVAVDNGCSGQQYRQRTTEESEETRSMTEKTWFAESMAEAAAESANGGGTKRNCRRQGRERRCTLGLGVGIHDAAVRGLIPIQGPLPVKFPLPDPQDPFLLRPGSLALHFSSSKAPEVAKTPNVSAAIAGARAAATTFSRDDQIATSNSYQTNETEKSEFGSAETSHAGTRKEDRRLPDSQNETQGLQASNCNQHTTHKERDENKRFVSEKTSRGSRLDPGASGKVSTTTS
ncbi:hypothetical protein BHM03_00047157 [Ensete ventricosum]|nr:hypothetical protein BHM03_00047157 [Ensete ventricosum]